MDGNRATAALRLHRAGERRELATAHPEPALTNLVVVFEEATRWRPGGTRAIFVVHAAVTWAHEETRLCEPAHGAAEMRAVDREDLEPVTLDVAHPARGVGRGSVTLHAHGVPINGQARLAFGEILDGRHLDPRLPAGAAHRRRDEPDHRNSHERGADHVQRKPELEEESSS